ncbi:type III-B CRISPR module RAMP protein Cmr1 [Herpetosiphon sp. NSE202]|uniref:type III-B CRISPR module RAMP protein Cmr1 n=1 Tax=Herpetosiphon sp. NSE202 TaxID=3351349 RepID=UPI00363B7032
MNRKPTISAPDLENYQLPNQFTIGEHTYITETRTYKLITPLFGGGVEAGVNDPITPIRASGIRGQLRFWWRAIRGGGYSSIEKMREEESKIWGSASTSSDSEKNQQLFRSVQINVTEVIHIEEQGVPMVIKPYKVEEKTNEPNKFITKPNKQNVVPLYIAFPLQPTSEEAQQIGKENRHDQIKYLTNNLKFTLEITYPESFKLEIQAALWAWETFGGVGGRTRRGFGSIRRTDDLTYPDTMKDFKPWLDTNFKKYSLLKHLHRFPQLEIHNSLRFMIFYKTIKSGLFGMWRNLIENFRDFRQAKNDDGRSSWPEPNQIRRITKQHLKHHNPDNVQAGQQHKIIKAFPRAQFGLPIIFQFKDNRYGSDRKDLDPRPTTLGLVNPNDSKKESERLASPLILKTFQCTNGDSIGLAFILSGTELSSNMELSLKANPSNPIDPKPEDLRFLLRDNEMLDINSISVEGNILEAFLAYLEGKMPKEK